MKKRRDQPSVDKNIHPPLIALFYIAAAYLLKWLIPIPYVAPVFLRNAGFGMVIVGFFFGVAALMEFRKARTTSSVNGDVKALVTGGVYKFTRNPIYLGFLLMVVGLPLNADNYWGLIVAPLFVVTLNKLVIEREEAYLGKKFPKEYADYKSRVRRWI